MHREVPTDTEMMEREHRKHQLVVNMLNMVPISPNCVPYAVDLIFTGL